MNSPNDQIIEALKKEINTLQFSPEVAVVGEVMEVGDGVARVSGLGSVKMSEMVEFIPEKGACVSGVAMNLEEDSVGVIVLGEQERLKEGDEVRLTGRILSVPVGEGFIGRVVNPLGEPMDGKGKVEASKRPHDANARQASQGVVEASEGIYYPVEKIAPGVIARESVNTPLQTGIKAIDAMIPIGRGQRELIIGDRQTGKTAIAMDTIVNQKGTGVICIYVAIGQKESKVAKMVADLEKSGAMEHTIVVYRALCRMRHGRILHGQGQGCAGRLRRFVQTSVGVQANVAAAAPPPGPRSLPGRRVLSPLPAAGARRKAEQSPRRRIAHRAPHHRDASRRRVGLYSHQCHFHH